MDACSKKTTLGWLVVVVAIGLLVYWQYREISGAGDKKLRQQIVGGWKVRGKITISNSADGTFVTIFPDPDTNSSGELRLEGSWDIKNGFMVFILTNVFDSTTSHMKHEDIGSVGRFVITVLDNRHISLKWPPYTNASEVISNHVFSTWDRQ